MKMRIGRRLFDIDNTDIIFDNGVTYQLLTQVYKSGWNEIHPVMSKTQFNKLIKEGKLELIERKLAYTTKNGEDVYHQEYQFRVE